MSEGPENIFFFPGSRGRRLLGVLFSPDPQGARGTGIVYCHPFAEEQNMSHAVAVKACRALSGAGYPVLRFDLSGCGDSEGTLDDMDIPSWLEDVRSAVEVIGRESGVSRVGLLGFRMGAGLAMLHAAHDAPDVPFLILWEPVLDFTRHIRQFLRRSLVSQIVANATEKTSVEHLERQISEHGRVEVIGYPVTRGLFESFCAVDTEPMHVKPHCPALVLSISQMDKPSSHLLAYRDLQRSAGSPAEFDHVQAEPFWDRYWRWECPEAIDRTVQWLKDKNG